MSALLLVAFLAISGCAARQLYQDYLVRHTQAQLTQLHRAVSTETVEEQVNSDWSRGMLELNPDYVGWLTVYGTEVDGPVVQGEDNDEYLRTDFYGDYSIGGVFFMDCLASLLYAVCLNAAEKRIPVQYAGKNGNRGAGSFIPVRLVTGGVMPVIFAGSVLGIPSMISLFVSGEKHPSLYRALTAFARGNWLYILLYAVLIFAFHRFYLAIQFDSTEIATNLRKRGGMIPGVRPGKPTADYLNRAIKGMADSGSLALVLVACLPMLLSKAFGISLQLGGTSLLIVVGVAIELAGQVDSQLTIRHHDGFLD